jgi:hypothetical protein
MKAFICVHGTVKCIAPFFYIVSSSPTLVTLDHQLDDDEEYFQLILKPVNTTFSCLENLHPCIVLLVVQKR